MRKNLVVGVSGASGVQIAVTLLKILHENPDIKTYLILSDSVGQTLKYETGQTRPDLEKLADVVLDNRNLGECVSSGSFKTQGMVIVPCSMKTVGGLASGYCDSLLLRTADVALKERRNLVLAVRETPLNAIHLKNMLALSTAGAIIFPLMVTYYNRPKDLDAMNFQIAARILEKFSIETPGFYRWGTDN